MGNSSSKSTKKNHSTFGEAESLRITTKKQPELRDNSKQRPTTDNDFRKEESSSGRSGQNLAGNRQIIPKTAFIIQSPVSGSKRKNKIIKLYAQVKDDSDLYLDLDTLRQNKSSAIKRKKPKYINRRLRVFSNDRNIFDQAIDIIQGKSSSRPMDMRGSIISYVEGDIEFVDLMTTSIRMFDQSESGSTESSIPTQVLDFYQTINRHSNPLQIIDSKPGDPRIIGGPGRKLIKVTKKKSRALIRPQDRQIVATDQDRQDAIPSSTRKAVWLQEFPDGQESKCYCCHCPLRYDEWHCGHILSRKEGGRIEKENLHPVCVDCNLGMGVNHMYEYMLVNRVPGIKSLDRTDPIVLMMEQVSTLIHYTWARIEYLKTSGYITATEAKKYREMVVSSKKTLSERMAVMVNISQYEKRVPSLLGN